MKLNKISDLLRERFRIDLIVLRDRPRLHHPGELRLLNENQPLFHMLLAPLHPAPSPAPLLVTSLVVCTFRFGVRALARRRLQIPTLGSGRSLPRGRHRRRLMIRLIDHDLQASFVPSGDGLTIAITHTDEHSRKRRQSPLKGDAIAWVLEGWVGTRAASTGRNQRGTLARFVDAPRSWEVLRHAYLCSISQGPGTSKLFSLNR